MNACVNEKRIFKCVRGREAHEAPDGPRLTYRLTEARKSRAPILCCLLQHRLFPPVLPLFFYTTTTALLGGLKSSSGPHSPPRLYCWLFFSFLPARGPLVATRRRSNLLVNRTIHRIIVFKSFFVYLCGLLGNWHLTPATGAHFLSLSNEINYLSHGNP